ncbi:hypothetical protein NL676_019018 [Syzygium grande]|nr:hypothetical protein NL676_019018 [Syzygium grande]
MQSRPPGLTSRVDSPATNSPRFLSPINAAPSPPPSALLLCSAARRSAFFGELGVRLSSLSCAPLFLKRRGISLGGGGVFLLLLPPPPPSPPSPAAAARIDTRRTISRIVSLSASSPRLGFSRDNEGWGAAFLIGPCSRM